jgi:hypothetical protein
MKMDKEWECKVNDFSSSSVIGHAVTAAAAVVTVMLI